MAWSGECVIFFIENTKTIEYIGESDEKSNETQIARVGDGDEG
tara:strand:+ start:226 stop:354 length:129 start_codon:yes stop_codon:yes gene_type:complete